MRADPLREKLLSASLKVGGGYRHAPIRLVSLCTCV